MSALTARLVSVFLLCASGWVIADSGGMGQHEELRAFLQENGIFMPKLALKDFEGRGVGMELTDTVSRGELLLFVPRNATIKMNTVRMSRKLRRVMKHISSLAADDPLLQPVARDPAARDVVTLGLFIATERAKSKSRWQPFLRSLPVTFNVSVVLGEDELGSILDMHSPTFYDLGKSPNPLLNRPPQQYSLYNRELAYRNPITSPALSAIGETELKQAMMAVWTTAVGPPRQVAPGLASLNHASDGHTIHFHDSTVNPSRHGVPTLPSGKHIDDGVYLVAERQLQKGEEVCLVYESEGNGHMFATYGFVDVSNPFERVPIYIAADDCASPIARDKLAEVQGSESGSLPSVDSSGEANHQLYVELLVATVDEAKANSNTVFDKALKGRASGSKHANKARRLLRALCQKQHDKVRADANLDGHGASQKRYSGARHVAHQLVASRLNILQLCATRENDEL